MCNTSAYRVVAAPPCPAAGRCSNGGNAEPKPDADASIQRTTISSGPWLWPSTVNRQQSTCCCNEFPGRPVYCDDRQSHTARAATLRGSVRAIEGRPVSVPVLALPRSQPCGGCHAGNLVARLEIDRCACRREGGAALAHDDRSAGARAYIRAQAPS